MTASQKPQYLLCTLFDRKPIHASIFDANNNAFIKMNNIAKADVFAITIEKRGGSEAPTISTMNIFGTISS